MSIRGYAETYFGFRRLLPQIRSRSQSMRREGERLAVNMPIQGSAADHMQIGMVKVQDYLEGLKVLHDVAKNTTRSSGYLLLMSWMKW